MLEASASAVTQAGTPLGATRTPDPPWGFRSEIMLSNTSGPRIAISAGAVISLAATVLAAPFEVIHCAKSGHPKALMPGAVDLNGDPETTERRALEDLSVTPDGSRWFSKSRSAAAEDHDSGLFASPRQAL